MYSLWDQFSGPFRKTSQAETVTFIMSVCVPTIRLPLEGGLWNLIFNGFSKNLSRKFKFSLNSYKSFRYFTCRGVYIHYNILLNSSPPPDGATARGGPWPPLQYASRSLGSLLCLSIRLHPSFSCPWTRHPAISFLVFLFVSLLTAFRTSFFWDFGALHSFYMAKPSYSLAFNKPDNVLSLDYGF